MPAAYISGHQCERCGHTWAPRFTKMPKLCPKCGSAYWDTPRVREAKKVPAQAMLMERDTVPDYILLLRDEIPKTQKDKWQKRWELEP